MRKTWCSPLLLLLLVVLALPATARDFRDPGRRTRALHGKSRSSPFDAPKANDRTFVVDDGALLDTGCIFRSDGPIVFQIPVTRAAGTLNADGTLKNAAQMVQDGVLSAKATLFMPVYDVDSSAETTPPEQPEVDLVSFNGHQIGTLSGENDVWKLNSFQIPIEYVKFPPRAAVGASPDPAMNEVRIDIDQANVDIEEDLWCTAVDWGTETIGAMSPILLIHGNNSDGGLFDRRGFTAALKAKNLLYDNSITMATDTVVAHGKILDDRIPPIVQSFGVDSVHLVAHSKGGLDSREYLAHYQPRHDSDFKVLSLTTLSTPHNGSVLADLLIDRAALISKNAKIDYSGFPSFVETVASKVSVDAGTAVLTTTSVAGFNAANLAILPADLVVNLVAADADRNGNGEIDRTPDEYLELRQEDSQLQIIDQEFLGQTKTRIAVDTAYQILRNTASIKVVYRHKFGFFGPMIAVLTSVPNATALGNDTLVTVPSGLGDSSAGPLARKTMTFKGQDARNHASVVNGGVAQTVIPWLLDTEKSNGDLKP